MSVVLWEPHDVADTQIVRYIEWLCRRGYISETFGDYRSLWEWSTGDADRFWASIWQFFDIQADGVATPVLADRTMPGARWFPDVRLNYAEHALRNGRPPGAPAVVAHNESECDPKTLTYDQLREQVARARAGFRRLGVRPGDRVAAYLPNIPEAVVAFLAAASLGAVWSCCPPEFGTRAVIERLGQIEPTVLLVVDGYTFGGKTVDLRAEHEELRNGLPTVTTTVFVPTIFDEAPSDDMLRWSELLAEEEPLEFDRVPFDHPLYVLYSSGTTGRPKPIVHGHGGMLLTHLKDNVLHLDIKSGDRLLWYTTTGWMMWNTVVSALLAGATIVLYDGNPAYPDLGALWRLAARASLTHFGVSASFLMGCRAAGIEPKDLGDLAALRFIGSTGSPLPPDGYTWVYDHFDTRVILGSVSGGTDVCSLLLGGSPLTPVWSGEMSCRALGIPVDSFDAEGNSVVDTDGELVITGPIPAMPVALYNDNDGSRYRNTWFDVYPGIWRQGDWITITSRGSAVISGRSDATLNRGGVRLGTAEFYNVLDALPEVHDSLVVHLDDPTTGHGQLILFVVRADAEYSEVELRKLVTTALRVNLSPRHVPDRVVIAPEIPYTRTGKKLEVPVKRLLQGADPSTVASPDALMNPASLAFYRPDLLQESEGPPP
ncbi:acetoacetate--CoA ligase [Mycobacteroides franklinii]|uniref:Acetoacetate--CoA ligase n=1 Tax=Mycobacteroides franklinii TaxID=948102 RepID=A0A1S1L2F8_9MYCO|nr:acetoacetate--CoA ligase [Mycobacteroides franklinii]OHU21279.1 acetoacetate--CoA ligase [Mycobacteroides franklinii]